MPIALKACWDNNPARAGGKMNELTNEHVRAYLRASCIARLHAGLIVITAGGRMEKDIAGSQAEGGMPLESFSS